MAQAFLEGCSRFTLQGQEQVQPQEGCCAGPNVMKEERWLPLVGQSAIKSSTPIHIRQRDAFTDHRLAQSDLRPYVIVTAILRAHEKWIEIMPTQICPRPEIRPKSRIMNDSIVA